MHILVTGANGQLGNELRILAQTTFQGRGTFSFLFTDVTQQEGVETTYLDITDIDAVRKMVSENDIDVIINCAAYTNVDAAESNAELAEKLNALAPENLAVAMREVNGLLVHISTDYVFGLEPYNTPCREEQTGTPTGVYGLTKLHGEQRIMASGCKHVIIRTAWLYSEFGKNFCKTMMNLIATKPELKVVFDQVGTPTYALDLAEAIMAIVGDYRETSSAQYDKAGIYHYSNEGVCSWYDFAKMIQQLTPALSDADGCHIHPCHSCEFPSPVKRPAYSVLDKTKIKQTFGIAIPYWTDSLRLCISRI